MVVNAIVLIKGSSCKLAGSVPVVIGAPNILDFAPSPNSLLHIKELKDAASVAKTMKYLAENPNAYNESLRYASISHAFLTCSS